MKIFMRVLALAVVAILALPVWAGSVATIKFDDLQETGILVYLNDGLIAGNGGAITQWSVPNNETVTFTYDTGLVFKGTAGVYYTGMMEPGVPQTLSDLITLTATNELSTLDVAFYSDGDGGGTLPTISAGWINLTTIQGQGLSNPLWEDGSMQLVGTYFQGGTNGTFDPNLSVALYPNTQFYVASDDVPEPATITGMLIGAGLLLAGFGARKLRR